MILRSDLSGSHVGATLFETMVALAILSLIVAVVATSARPPSPRLQQEAAVSNIVRLAQQTRLRAIQEGQPIRMDTDALCPEATAPVFYPDGSARFGPLCIGEREIFVRPVTGTLDIGS